MGQKYAAYDAQRTIVAFYDDAISSPPKGDPVAKISDAQYRELLTGQADGKRMAVDDNGSPVLLDPAPLSPDALANAKRSNRDAALSATDWLVARQQDETFAGGDTTLTASQFAALLAYRKALRDLPLADGWPDIDLPAAPDFLNAIA
ncbi:MAG: phage tail assembly chaperone [Paraburkholderia sp.]|jgi:hypothetical protein